MADNVFIQGIAGGVLKEAINELPGWATEKTANEIQSLLKKILKVETDALSKMSKTGVVDPKDMQDFADGLSDAAREFDKEKKRNKEKEDEHKRWMKSSKEELFTLSNLGAAFKKFGLAVKDTMVASVATFDELYRAGFDVTSGFDLTTGAIDSLRQMATLTNIRFTELAKVAQKYSEAVNAFGMQRFMKTVGQTSEALSYFGYSSVEAADLFGAYLTIQKGYTNANAKTQFELQKDLTQFGERMTRLSQATGIMRSKLIENVQALSESIEANVLSNRIGADATQETLNFIAAIKDQNLGKAILKMMTDQIKPLNTTFMAFQKTGFGGFGQKFMNFTKSLEGLSGEEQAARTAEFAKANEAELQRMLKQSSFLSQAGVAEADAVSQIIVGLQQTGRTYKAQTAADKAAADAQAKAAADLKSEQERFQAQLQKTFTATIPMLEMITTVLTAINDVFDGFREGVQGVLTQTQINMIGFGAAIAAVVSGLKMFSWTLGKVGSMMSGGGAGRGSGGGGIGGGGVGNGSALTGMANGLSAFANPKVVLGAAGFAASIALIGAGIAGATWILGKALPTLAEGLKPFTEIDGAKLLETGKGIAGLSVGLAALGAGSLVSGVGSLVSTITDGFSKMVGGKTVIERLQEFAALGPGLMQTATALQAMNGGIALPPLTPTSGSGYRTSTINSPSNVSTSANPANQVVAKEPNKPVAPGIEKSAPDTGINSMIGYQTSLLEQLLQSTNNLVSVNKDILKYSRVHS